MDPATGGRAGEGAWAALSRIAEAVRARFGADQEVSQTLERLEARPTSQGRTQELAEVLQARLTADPSFAAELQRLVEEAEQAGGVRIAATDVGVVAGRDARLHGQYVAGRDQTIGGTHPDQR
jgi:hypothetical protein